MLVKYHHRPSLSQIMVWNSSIVDAEISSLVLGWLQSLGWLNPFANHSVSFLKNSGICFRRISLTEGFISVCIRTKGFDSKISGLLNQIILFANFPLKTWKRQALQVRSNNSVPARSEYINWRPLHFRPGWRSSFPRRVINILGLSSIIQANSNILENHLNNHGILLVKNIFFAIRNTSN